MHRLKYLDLCAGISAPSLAWPDWECAGFSEIEPFCCRLLEHHYPGVPNLGNLRDISAERIAELGTIDVVVAGTPCQDLSVAGKRAGLNGARSYVFHEAVRIYGAARTFCGARFFLWENVPGCFSTEDGRDFAAVVGSLAGCEFDVPADGWRNAGFALGPDGLVEWSVLDARFFGVPQRRRRVFALLDSGDWSSRAPILLERESLQGHPEPCRTPRQDTTGPLEARAGAGGAAWGADFMTGGGLAHSLSARPHKSMRDDSEDYVISPPLGDVGNGGGANGPGRTVDSVESLIPLFVPQAMSAKWVKGTSGPAGDEVANLIPVAFKASHYARGKDGAPDVIAPPLSADADKGDQDTLIAFDTTQITHPENRFADVEVRRLTPRECERLQGMPDDYTRIPYRESLAKDGPRYRALGNSMAVPVVAWIGQRIAAAWTSSPSRSKI